MKYLVAIVLFTISTIIGKAQNLDFLNREKIEIYSNLSYGEFERNKFDLIVPTESALHGLVVFIHGGGFMHGDKKAIYKRKHDIEYFIDNNLAVASINYRFYKSNDSLGVKVCLDDVKRAIQYMRHHASKYNIDKERVGCYGVSAGAGSSLYLAFHNDMAIEGDTSLLGESTRLKCAGAIATQSTYDLFKWKKVIPWMGLVQTLKRKQFFDVAANFYGYENYQTFKEHRKEIASSLDLLGMIDDQDPPAYLMNLMSEYFPKDFNVIQHHRKHAVAVSKKMDKYKVENYLYTSHNAQNEKDLDFKVREFMVKYLK